MPARQRVGKACCASIPHQDACVLIERESWGAGALAVLPRDVSQAPQHGSQITFRFTESPSAAREENNWAPLPSEAKLSHTDRQTDRPFSPSHTHSSTHTPTLSFGQHQTARSFHPCDRPDSNKGEGIA